jgi:PPK2 family polyphosphate:nucleotide phosphotransferase
MPHFPGRTICGRIYARKRNAFMNRDKLVQRFRIDRPETFKLSDFDPGDTGELKISKEEGKEQVAEWAKDLAELQERLYAQDKWAVLMILQGMDASGKDGIVEHVFHGVNPMGCDVHAFKAPTADELDHTFLWRVEQRVPQRGRIGIFNRSHYEECLVVRVHPEILGKQKLPPSLVTKNIWKERFEDIRSFERHLVRNGTVVLKFHLRISKDEQRKRFLDRLDEPNKRWKFNMGDVKERDLWPRYMAAYQDMIRKTSTKEAPWIVVPADHKWFARLVVSAALLEALEKIDPKFPALAGHSPADIKKVRAALEADGGKRGA